MHVPGESALNMAKLSKEKKDRLVLVCVVTLVVVAGLWFGVVSMQQGALAADRKKIQDAIDKVEKAKRLSSMAAKIEENLTTAKTKLDEVEGGMASGDLYSWVILTLNKFRAAHQVNIPDFSRELRGQVGVLPNFPYEAATFTVRGNAYFHDLGKFLADFENTFPYMRVQNLEIEPASAAGVDRERLTFKIEIVALIKPTPAN